jgi:uncharacterized protein YbgA (DUF1722 family)/uncharacterized protein YbbK (DUF523 family)
MKQRITIGVSSCLLGNQVRYDGGHKRDRYLTDTLADYFDFEPFCPEIAIGLGVPRSTIQLWFDGNRTQLVDSRDNSRNHTGQMMATASEYCQQLGHLGGYILKSKSPSCGMERVPLYRDTGHAMKEGTGLYAATLLHEHPFLPVEEEGRLNDAAIRENFIERVFAFHRWQRMRSEEFSVNSLMQFHRRHKFILLAHNESIYRQLGKLVAETDRNNLDVQADHYIEFFTAAMKCQVTPKRHVNVLQHCMGYLKNCINNEDKSELLELFEKYANKQVPLVVPVTLLKHHFRKNPNDYVEEQYYMNPYPEELMLRNHV